jgi:hypothetical protein
LGLTLSVYEKAKWVFRRRTITLATVDKHSPERSSRKSTGMRWTEAFAETGAIKLQLGGNRLTLTQDVLLTLANEQTAREETGWRHTTGIELSWRASS